MPAPTDIVIVRIDDRSIGQLGTWPLPRSLHGRVIDRLHAAGAREIVYDIQFTEPSDDEAEDLALYDAIGNAGGVTLATSQMDAHGNTNVLGGDANLAQVGAQAAAANLTTSHGGVMTRFPYVVLASRASPSWLQSACAASRSRDRGSPAEAR